MVFCGFSQGVLPEVRSQFVCLGSCLLIDVGTILSEVDFCIIEHATDMARGDYGHVKKISRNVRE